MPLRCAMAVQNYVSRSGVSLVREVLEISRAGARMSEARRYVRSASPALVRRTWAAVSATPCASVRQLARRIRASWSSVNVALHILRDAGYVTFEDRAHRSRRVLVPFAVVPRRPRCVAVPR